MASYYWIVNGSDYYHRLFEENRVINYTAVKSSDTFFKNYIKQD